MCNCLSVCACIADIRLYTLVTDVLIIMRGLAVCTWPSKFLQVGMGYDYEHAIDN